MVMKIYFINYSANIAGLQLNQLHTFSN